MTKQKIGLVGYFGWGNFGDELFLKSHIAQLGGSYELEVVHDLLEDPYFSRPIDEIVQRYDAFIIGGGDLINPTRVSPLYWQMSYLRKPVFVFGLGVPNQRQSRDNATNHYRAFFQHPNCKLTIARDPESRNWLRKQLQPANEVAWYPDPVCSMDFPEKKEPTCKTLGVVFRSHRSVADDWSALRAVIDRGRELGYAIKHIVLGTMGIGQVDAEITRKLADEGEEVFVADDLDTLCAEISSCSMLATIKFHGLVVATMYGIPAIALSVTPKNRNFLRIIAREEMGGGYTQSDTWKRLSYHPAKIHPLVVRNLRNRSLDGYAKLKASMAEHLG